MKALTRDEFLGLDDQVIEPHPVKDGIGVYVRSITAGERGAIEADAARFKESKGKGTFAEEFTVNMVLLGACDENGKRLFEKREDVALLKKKNSAMIAKIAEHVQRLSGFSKEDLKELEQNLSEAQPGDSPSA